VILPNLLESRNALVNLFVKKRNRLLEMLMISLYLIFVYFVD